MAAGLEDAYQRGDDLAGKKVLAVGYGSGDAAEAIPMTVAPQWRSAAAKIGFEAALEAHQDLTQAQYETLHDTGTARGLSDPENGFVIESIGSSANPKFSDEGIEYYRFVR
jgi:hydroxymethylglutaryl-CoA synthase